MKFWRPVLLLLCSLCVLLLATATLRIDTVLSQGPEDPETEAEDAAASEGGQRLGEGERAESLSTFQITFDELGYEERSLHSPYGVTEYTLYLPEGWELREGSVLQLDFSYTYSHTGIPETQAFPSVFADVRVIVDGRTQQSFLLQEPEIDRGRVRVPLPTSLLNYPNRLGHTIKVALDAGYICDVPHRAALIIHPTSSFSLEYDQLPVATDLALYPRPFYQRSFEPDRVLFVLSSQPTEMELAGAMATAAKLGDLAYNVTISGTTDLGLTDRLEAMQVNEPFHEHLIVVGKPESNDVILKLNQLGVLPVALRERQVGLTTEGPAAVAPGDVLTYTLVLTNTSREALSALSLVDALPAYARVVSCDPSCSKEVEGEVSWSISSLPVGETRDYRLALRVSEVITDSAIENTVTLFDSASKPLNVSTVGTVVGLTPPSELGQESSNPVRSRYFFVQGERAVPESDGVVQYVVSPWDPARAILVVSGLSDEAVHKAGQAMGFESHTPGMEGPFALVRELLPLPESSSVPQATDRTFADLGYDDRALEGRSLAIDYYFHVPLSWRMTEDAFLKLHFSHSQLINYERSSLSVLFNRHPIATVALNDETSLDGQLQVGLPPSQVDPGRNRISIRAEMQPIDECAPLDAWLFIDSASLIHLDHSEQASASFDLDLYPHPFDQRPDLADVLFALPPEPRLDEWRAALKLAAALGSASGGSNLVPMLAYGATWSEAELAEYHIIALGSPLRNPMLRQVNSQLPQPFQPDSNEIEQRLGRVVFRLPPGLNLGLVQLLPSPWNQERVFLAVTGTTDEGVRSSVDVLVNRYWALKGNLAFIRDGEVETIDTRSLMRNAVGPAIATAVPGTTSVDTSTGTPLPQPNSTPVVSSSPPDSSRAGVPGWIAPLIGLNGLIVIAIVVFVLWRARKNRM
jgi:uncharacterized repeat protein (TIGR01451 family)